MHDVVPAQREQAGWAESHVDYPERGVALLLELELLPPSARCTGQSHCAAEEPGERRLNLK